MRYVLIFFVALCVATILSGCPGTTSSPDIDSEQATTNPPTETNRIEDPEPIPTTPQPVASTTSVDTTLDLVFTLGVTPAMKNIYAAWIDFGNGTPFKNIRVCPSLVQGGGPGSALTYWRENAYPLSSPKKDETGFDAISSSTVFQDNFSVRFVIPAGSPIRFTVWFETDYSFNQNDWFQDQPSVVYRCDVDLSSSNNSFSFALVGWATISGNAGMQSPYITPMPASGVLNTETRYITHKRNTSTGGFGDADTSNSIVTKTVGNLVVTR